MDYTQSANHNVAANGQRKHQNTTAPTTRVTKQDMNGLMWEIMEVIKAGVTAGAYPAALAFDEANPASYSQLKSAVQKLISNAVTAGINNLAPESHLTGYQSYNAATDTLNLAMSDGSTVGIPVGALILDAVAGVSADLASEIARAKAVENGKVNKTGPAIFGSEGGANIGVSYSGKNESDAPLSYAAGFTTGVNMTPDLSLPFGIKDFTSGAGLGAGVYWTFQNGDNPQLTYQIFFVDPTGATPSKGGIAYRNCLNNTWTPWYLVKKDLRFGIDQSLSDVTISRAFGVTYTNTTSLPIWVSVSLTLLGGADSQLVVNGIVVSTSDAPGGFNAWAAMQALVPPNATYQANVTGSYGGVVWSELR